MRRKPKNYYEALLNIAYTMDKVIVALRTIRELSVNHFDDQFFDCAIADGKFTGVDSDALICNTRQITMTIGKSARKAKSINFAHVAQEINGGK